MSSVSALAEFQGNCTPQRLIQAATYVRYWEKKHEKDN